jgi:hypothetical protein
MEVQIVKTSGCMTLVLGVFTLGVAPLAIWLQQRNWPARLDEEGLVTRGGKRIVWEEFTRAVRVVTRIASGVTVERIELHSPKGKVLVPGERLVDGQRVVQYILEHLPEKCFSQS